MVVGSRRRGLAAAVTALAAVALAAAVAGRGCGAEEDSPVGTVRAFAAAARAGDRGAMFELLTPASQERLEEASRRASRLVSERRFRPTDLLSVGEAGEPRSFELRERDGARAVVDVVDEQGGRTPMTVREIDGRWRVELP